MRPIMRLVKPLVAATLALSLNATSGMAEVVPVVSAKSSVTTLTRNQVTDIFLGKTSRFPNGEQAVPIDQTEGSAARDEFSNAYAAFQASLTVREAYGANSHTGDKESVNN